MNRPVYLALVGCCWRASQQRPSFNSLGLEILLNDDIGSSKPSILAYFVVGGLAGAAAALLLAKNSGRHTRSSITRRLRHEVDRGRTAGGRMTGKTREWLDGASRYLGKQEARLEPQHHGHVATSGEHEAGQAT